MFTNIQVVNTAKIVRKVSLKELISGSFKDGKFFYSIEITPKTGIKLDFSAFKTLPLFVDITWIKNDNLKIPLRAASAFDLARKIESSHVVNSLTCYCLNEKQLDEILGSSESIRNFTILRGGKTSPLEVFDENILNLSDLVDDNQKFRFANELISEIRRKTAENEKFVTIFAGGYPETHPESNNSDEDLQNLKRKVECGVDVILTQTVFSAKKFVEFTSKCREVGISTHVPIIPGLYIPYTFQELKTILKITKVSMEPETFDKFETLKDDLEEFQEFSLNFMMKMIREIQENSSEFIRGFHFYTMNNFKMVQELVKVIDFTEEPASDEPENV